ncbi:MAG: hypothetical protein KME16_00055 [Scytolyngbya sp. HA4215-MV1]|nr:hypothetical protein [Scytolyngbya sp. HA4215-MV1]
MVVIGFSLLPIQPKPRTIVRSGERLQRLSHLFLCVFLLLAFPSRSLAESSVTPPPPGAESQVEHGPVENDLVEMTSSCTAQTNDSLSDRVLNLPSLSWLQSQLAERKRYGNQPIKAWSACRGNTNILCKPGDTVCRVDVEINRQLWSLLDHLERYELVNKLGYEFVNQFVDLSNPPPGNYHYNVQFFDRPPNYTDAAEPSNQLQKRREVKPEALYECSSRIAPDASTPTASRLVCQIGPLNFVNQGWRLPQNISN